MSSMECNKHRGGGGGSNNSTVQFKKVKYSSHNVPLPTTAKTSEAVAVVVAACKETGQAEQSILENNDSSRTTSNSPPKNKQSSSVTVESSPSDMDDAPPQQETSTMSRHSERASAPSVAFKEEVDEFTTERLSHITVPNRLQPIQQQPPNYGGSNFMKINVKREAD